MTTHSILSNEVRPLRPNKKPGIYFVLAMLACASSPLPVMGVTYHVRSDGTAANKLAASSCLSPSTSMNVAAHNSQSFAPGDLIVLCNEGGTYRSTLRIPSSGTADNRITYDGRKTAVFIASDVVDGWSRYSNDIYSTAFPAQPEQMFIDRQFAQRKDSISELEADKDWYWDQNTLYLLSPGGNPSQIYSNPGIEVGSRDNAIYVGASHYITIRGVRVMHAKKDGIMIDDGTSFRLLDSILEWNYYSGVNWSGSIPHGNGLIEGNTCRFNGVSGILVNDRFTGITIRRNTCHGNGKYQETRAVIQRWTSGIKVWGNIIYGSSTVIEENVIFDNGYDGGPNFRGVGIWVDECSGVNGRNIVRRNVVYENNGHGLYIEKSDNTDMHYNVVYDNGPAKWAAGIALGGSGTAVNSNNSITNNTVWGARVYGISCGVWDDGGAPKLYDNTIANNVVYASADANFAAENACLNNGRNGTGNEFYNNAFGDEGPGLMILDWSRVNSYSEWEEILGQPTYSVAGPPRFIDPLNANFLPLAVSPLIDTGRDLGNERAQALAESTTWPDDIRTENQYDCGPAWEIGAFAFVPNPDQSSGLIFLDDFSSGTLELWIVVN